MNERTVLTEKKKYFFSILHLKHSVATQAEPTISNIAISHLYIFHVFSPNGQVIYPGEGGPSSREAGLSVINDACREIWHELSVPIHDSCNFCYKFLNKSLFR